MSGWSGFVAAGLAAGAAWLAVPGCAEDRAERLSRPSPTPASGAWRARGHRMAVRFGVGPASRRRRTRDRLRMVHALAALAAELSAGQPAATALIAAGGSPSAWPGAAAAAQLGDDVVAALHDDARAWSVLRSLAACWQVSIESGTGLAEAVSALAESVRSAEDTRVQLEAELAGPRATARTLAVLPVAGIGFGMLLGGDPVGWLVGTSPGLLCLMGGIALTVAGYVWTGRIAARVEAML